MSRRYGRLTLTGWIDDKRPLHHYVHLYSSAAQTEGPQVVWTDPTAAYSADVVYLPEPFNDGDVVRFLDVCADVVVRVHGAWRCSRPSHTVAHVDAEIAQALTAGLAVRLIEVTP